MGDKSGQARHHLAQFSRLVVVFYVANPHDGVYPKIYEGLHEHIKAGVEGKKAKIGGAQLGVVGQQHKSREEREHSA